MDLFCMTSSSWCLRYVCEKCFDDNLWIYQQQICLRDESSFLWLYYLQYFCFFVHPSWNWFVAILLTVIDTCNLLELFTSVGDYSSSLDGVMEKYDKIIVEIMIVSCKKMPIWTLVLASQGRPRMCSSWPFIWPAGKRPQAHVQLPDPLR